MHLWVMIFVQWGC